MAKKMYQVTSPISFDGKDYGVGDPIDLEDKHAADLVGSIENAPASGNKSAAPTDPAERAAAIKEAIGILDKGNAALWTGGGMPKMPAIAAVTGWDVTQAERDAVWVEINKV